MDISLVLKGLPCLNKVYLLTYLLTYLLLKNLNITHILSLDWSFAEKTIKTRYK